MEASYSGGTSVYVENHNNHGWGYVALFGLIFFFVLFAAFIGLAIIMWQQDEIVTTDSDTNFQQPTFTNANIVYPTTYNGVPNANIFDIPTARLAIAACQSATNQFNRQATFVNSQQYNITPVNAPFLALTATQASPSPYKYVLAFPDQNMFTLATNGSWNQSPWFSYGNMHAGMANIANFCVNSSLSIISSIGPNVPILITGHGAGAGVALAIATRALDVYPNRTIITYVSGLPLLGDWNLQQSINNTLSNFWVFQNQVDNIGYTPFPVMTSPTSGQFGYIQGVPLGKYIEFVYQTLSSVGNHDLNSYSFILNPTNPQPYTSPWSIQGITL
jgi:hypothetical protein